MTEILQFIAYINGYIDDDYREYVDFVPSTYYFTNGGCYEFAKIIKHFIPSAIIYHSNHNSEKYKNHIIVKIGNFYYDSKGLIKNEIAESEFYEVNDAELDIISDFIGYNGKRPLDDLIINETEMILSESSGKSILELLNIINDSVKPKNVTLELKSNN